MKSILRTKWEVDYVTGSEANTLIGPHGTVGGRQGHAEGNFAGKSTLVLGAANSELMHKSDGSKAKWIIPLSHGGRQSWITGYLVIGCIRRWGGCHSGTPSQRVSVRANDSYIDRFRLKHIPDPHDDYFYRPTIPDFPRLDPFDLCQTLYAWPVLPETISDLAKQDVTIHIQSFIRWDIDYLGFVWQRSVNPDYDVALSFAGENRPYVEEVARHLIDSGLRVFYDDLESISLWGKDLFEHLAEIYHSRSRFVLMFVSEHYARKIWTRHERRAAQARALYEEDEYILPVRFDSAEIPGLLPTTGYLDISEMPPSELARMTVEKLK